MNRCFFIGHHDIDDTVYDALYQAIERACRLYAVDEFLIGGLGAFDRIASRAVLAYKSEHPSIRLYRLLPYYSETKSYPLPPGYDGSLYLISGYPPKKTHIVISNEKAINSSICLIACTRHPGKARDFLDYAKKRQEKGLIHIIEI